MQRDLDRRAFVGRTAGGLPLVGNGAVLWAQSDASASPHLHGESGPDALERQTLLELARLYREMKLRGSRGENVRAFAARIRTMAVYYQATGRSDAVSRRVAALVDEHGCDSV